MLACTRASLELHHPSAVHISIHGLLPSPFGLTLHHHFIHFHMFSIRLHMPQQVRGTSGDMCMGGNASCSHHHHLQFPSCSSPPGFTQSLPIFPTVSLHSN